MQAAPGEVMAAELKSQYEGALTRAAIRRNLRDRVQPSCRTSAIHWIIPNVILPTARG